MRIWPDWWPKRPRIRWMWNQQLPNYKVFSDWWKLASWIFLGKREKMRVCYWFEREMVVSDDYIPLNSYARLSFNKSKVLNEKGCLFMFKFPNIIMMYLIKLLKYYDFFF